MQPEEKRELIEIVTNKIVIGKEEITINLCYAPSSKETAIRWRKGSFLNPFCHLVIRATRVDSPPFGSDREQLQKVLLNARSRLNLSRNEFALKIGVSGSTLKNWERGRTKPNPCMWRLLFQLQQHPLSSRGILPSGVRDVAIL
jgi:DNA-binding XRE family transcriptional regulator